jgi:hypothetical protein
MSSREFYSRIEQINGVWPSKRQGERGFTGIRFGKPQDAEDDEGHKGQEGQVSLPPFALHGKKGRKPAPPAPSAPDCSLCGGELLSAVSVERGHCERCELATERTTRTAEGGAA